MALDKAIKFKKELRKPYYKSKAFAPSCRNHGGCPACEENRKHGTRKRLAKSDDVWYSGEYEQD